VSKILHTRCRMQWLLLLATALVTGSLASRSLAIAPSFWSPPLNLSGIPGRSFQTATTRDPTSGDLFVVWTDDGVSAREEVLGRHWDQTKQKWLPAENLSKSESWQRDGGPAIAFDNQGQGLLIWTRTYAASQGAPADGYDVLWRKWNGSAWSPEATLLHGEAYLPGSPGTFGLIPVVKADSILLFITWSTGYRTTEYSGGTWSEVSPWIYLDVSLADIITDRAGILHVAAFGENSNQTGYNRWFQDAYYLTYDGVQWSEPLNLSFTDGVANNVGLAFDGQGHLHFLWSDPDSVYSDESLQSAIWERVYREGSWTPNSEVTKYHEDQAMNGFSLAADASGTLHLAWSEGVIVDNAHSDLQIRYQPGNGKTWGPVEDVYTSTAASRYPLVGLGEKQAYIVWQEIFWAGGPLNDHEVYVSHQVGEPPKLHHSYLPLIGKEHFSASNPP